MRSPLLASGIAIAAAIAVAAPARASNVAAPTLPAGSAAVLVTAHPLTPADAPADEYFGRLKLSNLGVRNIIHALKVEGTSPLALPLERTRIMGVHSAIVEWGDAFPRDTWLRSSVVNFADVLVAKHDPETDLIAIDLLLQASQRFRNTPYSKTVLARAQAIELSNGIDWSVVPFDPPSYSQTAELHPGRF